MCHFKCLKVRTECTSTLRACLTHVFESFRHTVKAHRAASLKHRHSTAVHFLIIQSQSCMSFSEASLNATAHHAVTRYEVACCYIFPLRAEMCDKTASTSCLACYSCSNEQLLSWVATFSLVVGKCNSLTFLLCCCRFSALVVLDILRGGNLHDCMLFGQLLQGENRSVMLHAGLLRICANDKSMQGRLVFCCPGAAHAIPSACNTRCLWM